MRLLRRSDTSEFRLTQFHDEAIPPYAILSHTWGADAEEVTFEDLTNGTGKDKPGYKKIRFCGEQAALDDLEWFWIDTCCINKANHAELSQAINSMFRWYRNATRCYVYLSDVSSLLLDTNEEFTSPWEPDFQRSKWFTRGWTLQELLAPSSVEFFSQEQKRLGDKVSLRRQIHKITGIPDSALQGACLSQFNVNERLSWKEGRHTKLEEDGAYSLLGIFGVYIPPIYGEGTGGAFKRLLDEIGKLEKCMQDLRLADPRDDKKRIEETKGGLLADSYHWIFENPDFQRWRNDQQSRLLWIKGDPGKGKTMLLCGIINELHKSIANTALLTYFFCQATDSRINNATAVLRGLLYLLVEQQPSLVSYIRKKHDYAGKVLFEDANAWVALSEIFKNILQDASLKTTYLVIDALDECITDLPKLLDFIVYASSSSARVKWLLSSRNELYIEQKLRFADEQARLSLELKENAKQVSRAVDVYIDDKLSRLESIQDDDDLTGRVRDILRRKANGTFLWVALVVQELERPESWDPLQVVEEVPTDLHQLYGRMLNQIQQLPKRNSEVCRLVLSTAIVAYRPLHLAEIGSLCRVPGQILGLTKTVRKIVAMCGSFLTIRENQVYLIHQSAKDYLSDEARATMFPSQGKTHHGIFSRSLELMSGALQRDMYRLIKPDFPIDQVQVPGQDPLGRTRYSCVHWVDHLCDSVSGKSTRRADDLQDGGVVYVFIEKQYLYWLEALSLCKSMSEGVVSMAKLETLVQGRANAFSLIKLVRDARRFIMYHKWTIENSPLQAYASALVFSPARSLIRGLFKEEEPKWITIKPAMGDKWSACLQTLEGHSGQVWSVAFSHDSTRLASASGDKTVKIWDASSGECLQTLRGHSGLVWSVAFSCDSTRLASASDDKTVKIWDVSSGECLQTLNGHYDPVRSVIFSHDSTRLASASYDKTVKIWDVSSGEPLQTLKGHSDSVRSVAFSHDSTRLASASDDKTVKIWNASSGECLQTLEGHSNSVWSVAFSHDSTRLASASYDKTVKIWDASSGECLQTLKVHSRWVGSAGFSHDSTRLASASGDNMVKIWDVSSGEPLQTLRGHSGLVWSVAFSCDSTRLASASDDKTVKIWDVSSGEPLQTLEGHSDWVWSVAFSHDSARVASGSSDKTVKIWNARSGECLQTLEGHSSGSSDKTVKIWNARSGECLQTLKGHSSYVSSVAFSHDSARVASGSSDKTVKIWNARSGECLQTLTIGRTLRRISFDISGSYLHTNIGTINISALSGSVTLSTISEPCSPQYQGLSLSADGVWITHNSENLVWLPSEYRPSCSAVSRNTISIGVGTGRVWICKVKPDVTWFTSE
ncbi:beta transducin-like protein HET-D2Y [Lentithecium fluviatile CBS 122367]|uniref:Mitochondrial division protein 1 n=1 Tax=Lentithecium fluviatile CBS 122367 TaxID=1168545 RepID=A0A6G1II68_9PLEO|nr:beta transducin-like protein HET-D2Y [Lentithecium fluviatile CBS 122367]